MKNHTLTETEKTWRVGENCYGLELLTMPQRNAIHNLKTYGYTLENVTPSGVALLYQYGIHGVGYREVYPSGKVFSGGERVIAEGII
jgi:hypothetical protein